MDRSSCWQVALLSRDIPTAERRCQKEETANWKCWISKPKQKYANFEDFTKGNNKSVPAFASQYVNFDNRQHSFSVNYAYTVDVYTFRTAS